MAANELNLGILAHVDAGKTTLTERLLYEAGAIDAIGSVDAGTTQTDSLALERQRGITIKSAVASFASHDVHVNLIDTPGHPDFIAEVERVLSVLDGAVLVVSAVEGVQPQTHILMRALQRGRIPTLVFVNKIDRAGADDERVLQAISERLTTEIVGMGAAHELGTRVASFTPYGAEDVGFRARLVELLSERDESLMRAYVEDDSSISYRRLREELVRQTKRALVHPVFVGSAITGAGVEPLMAGIAELLPAAGGDPDDAVAATVFKIERGAGGEKIAYARMFSGTIRTRDRVRFGSDHDGKVTSVAVFESGPAVQRPAVAAGAVAKLWGLAEIRIGDRIGELGTDAPARHFAPPTLESVVAPRDPDDRARLRVALAQLAEQDPLIDVRQNDTRHEISVSLYGEVQKEVIQSTLAEDFGIDVDFRETTPIYVERPAGTGEAVEILNTPSNPFTADIGLRVEPAPHGTGIEFRLAVPTLDVPLSVYKTLDRFAESMGRYVEHTFREGCFGWQVTDCRVTMTTCGWAVADGPPSRRGTSTAADYRKLTPIVAMHALQRAGSVVCEPVVRASVELPVAAIGAVTSALARLDAAFETPSLEGSRARIEALLPAVHAHELQRQLAGLTGGEGVLESSFAGYQPVHGDPPVRPRTTANPLNLAEYTRQLARGGVG